MSLLDDVHEAMCLVFAKKLERDLTEAEREGIFRIQSFMMCEAFERYMDATKNYEEALGVLESICRIEKHWDGR